MAFLVIWVCILNRMEILIACWLTPDKYISAISENHTDAALLPSKETVFHIPKNALHIMSIITNLNIFSIDYNYIWNRIWKNSHFITLLKLNPLPTSSLALPNAVLVRVHVLSLKIYITTIQWSFSHRLK